MLDRVICAVPALGAPVPWSGGWLDAKRRAREQPESERLRRIVVIANAAAKAMGHAFGPAGDWDAVLALPELRQAARVDLPGSLSPERLVELIQAQQEHLDQYVQHMASTESTVPPVPRMD